MSLSSNHHAGSLQSMHNADETRSNNVKLRTARVRCRLTADGDNFDPHTVEDRMFLLVFCYFSLLDVINRKLSK